MPPKRKPDGQGAPPAKRARFTHFQDARQIAAQTSETAYGNGELDVNKFVKAREYEIKALENGMRKSRATLSSRAFQTVPRELRRRTASHNVKRVPKRLQKRAKREMLQDNTPTVNSKTRKPSGHDRLRLEIATKKQRASAASKARREKKKSDALKGLSGPVPIRLPHVKKDRLAKPPRPKAKFRKRQQTKTWLPTHMFHTKRAHMTPPNAPLWRMALPLTPTQKCYRPTHRAGNARSAVAWDMSYMSTIALHGTQEPLEALCKSIGVGGAGQGQSWWTQRTAKKWISGKRAWTGLIHEPSRSPQKAIAPVTIVWDPRNAILEQVSETKRKPKRQIFIRIHPAAFLQLWEELLEVSKTYKPKIMIEDLRFDVGSIEVSGPSAAEALVGVMHPVESSESTIASSLWPRLHEVDNPGILPPNSVLGFSISDPRLSYPPRTVKPSRSTEQHAELLKTLHEWPLDASDQAIGFFERYNRVLATRRLPSQKSVNRRKSQADPGAYPEALDSDPNIPVLVLTNKSPNAQGQGSFTVLLPWKCVLPVWYCLMHYPLRSGGNVRFGGLEQRRQLAFEAGTPWFPGDYPGTKAGAAWEEQEQAKRKTAWEKRPKSKRIAWQTVDLGAGRRGEVGEGWACGWSKLRLVINHDASAEFTQVSGQVARARLNQASQATPKTSITASDGDTTLPLAIVEISVDGKGVPTECARIYRLPTTDEQLRTQWLSLANPDPRRKTARALAPSQRHNLGQKSRAELAAWLLAERDDDKQAAQGPAVPDEIDLIGFSTAGNFNLSHGKGSCIASIALEQLRPSQDKDMCIVRESGQGLARLARWRIIQ